jgi:hypothetical protein
MVPTKLILLVAVLPTDKTSANPGVYTIGLLIHLIPVAVLERSCPVVPIPNHLEYSPGLFLLM